MCICKYLNLSVAIKLLCLGGDGAAEEEDQEGLLVIYIFLKYLKLKSLFQTG